MENEQLRRDETSALSAIFAEDWAAEDLKGNRFSVTLKSDQDSSRALRIDFKLPPLYPTEECPTLSISAPWMSREDKADLSRDLSELCEQNRGQSVLYTLIERAKETLTAIVEKSVPSLEEETVPSGECPQASGELESTHSSCDIRIWHGTTLLDRRSTFQAHLAAVHSVLEAEQVLAKLKENRKICSATHNMWACRLSKDSRVVHQNCDDDGESHAGSRLLHLLQIVDARNVIVVVSRWYGGIQLGPDRFKHINNVARQLLLEHNYISK